MKLLLNPIHLVLQAAFFLLLAGTAAANPVHQLAQGCYAIQSPKNGQYLQSYRSRRLMNDGMGYRFRKVGINSASRFYLKPSALGEYLLTDFDGRYLSADRLMRVVSSDDVRNLNVWQVSTNVKNGTRLFSLRSKSLNMVMRHNYRRDRGKVYFFDFWNMRNRNSESSFKFIATNDCQAPAEVALNISGDRRALESPAGLPIRGYVEAHAHITSNEFLGGKMLHGEPFHPLGVTEALGDSRGIHGPRGALDIIGNLLAYDGVSHRYDTAGWPDFPFWPNYKQMSHTGYYYRWMERAYLSGMRLLVTHLVENRTLCRIQSTVNPAGWIGANSCNTMDSIRLQINKIREMQDYIDAQAGGVGKGFFRIVTSPEQARSVIAQGKMAVLLGVEASETFNCGIGDPCTPERVDRQLDELYRLGVRSVYPVHKFDNQFGGSQVREGNGFINLGHYMNTGYFWQVKECDEQTRGKRFTSGFPLFPDAPFISDLLGFFNEDLNPEYDESIESCNQNGLSSLGNYLVNRLIDKKMLIEIDHTSVDAYTSIMNIVEARNYSGVVSSHGWEAKAKNGGLHENTKRLIRQGGYISPYSNNASRLRGKVQAIVNEIEQTPFYPGVGVSTDMGGLGGQVSPRNDSDTNPLAYPFVNEFGFVTNQQKSGNRVFDFNRDGVAHYGLLADFIQDLREQFSPQLYDVVMNSAEAYLQMWERSTANTSYGHVYD